MKYKYFCGSCGRRFESDVPFTDKNGIHNDIWCPECGAVDIFEDTPEGAGMSAGIEIGYQAELAARDEE